MSRSDSIRRSRLAGASWRLHASIGPIAIDGETPTGIVKKIMSVTGEGGHDPHRAFNNQVDRQVYQLERILDRMLAE